MGKKEKIVDLFYTAFLSENTKRKSEKIIVFIAIVSFIIHLLIITLVDLDILHFKDSSRLLNNPIAAIYTPFSFILIYEVYLLVFYLPKSTSIYIGKQYEIITLIIIRRVFKDLSRLEFTSDWFTIKNDLEFSYDLIATLILFFLISIFYRFNDLSKIDQKQITEPLPEITRFIRMKKIIAMCLVPVFLGLAIYSLYRWIDESFFTTSLKVEAIKDVNTIFFDDFFTVLILIDVLLLLFSFLHTDKFNKVVRNSGFIISTILIKLSFSAEGVLNTILIVVAVLFGVTILGIHNRYEKSLTPDLNSAK
jgi:hypothetical protein